MFFSMFLQHRCVNHEKAKLITLYLHEKTNRVWFKNCQTVGYGWKV